MAQVTHPRESNCPTRWKERGSTGEHQHTPESIGFHARPNDRDWRSRHHELNWGISIHRGFLLSDLAPADLSFNRNADSSLLWQGGGDPLNSAVVGAEKPNAEIRRAAGVDDRTADHVRTFL